jgi:hypothetical protein
VDAGFARENLDLKASFAVVTGMLGSRTTPVANFPYIVVTYVGMGRVSLLQI